MTNLNIENSVFECLKRVKKVKQNLSLTLHAKADLGLESIELVDLLFELEQETGAPLSLGEFNDFVTERAKGAKWDFTLGDLATFVNQRRT